MKYLIGAIGSFFRRAQNLFSRHTPVTASIKLLIGHKRNTWILASLAYGLPAFLVLTGFFLSRRDVITHDGLTILLVYIAAIWAWIGPVFIWRYEHITTTKYLAM